MLFSSFTFLIGFLPSAILTSWIASLGPYWLYLLAIVGSSAIFYAWHVPEYVALLAISAGFNFVLSSFIEKHRRRWLFIVGIAANLAALGYFKYWNFAVLNLDRLLGLSFKPIDLILPLAISFITFEQIAFLSDVHAGRIERSSFLRYLAFISFFPKLIAGPIIRYTELLPQFRAEKRPSLDSLVTGLSIFFIGLFKKVAIADQLAPMINRVYGTASTQLVPSTDAALATIAYAAQIYFDFSGYSDMAIGIAWMLGLTLPVNFFSPYKATSIIDFWRRWHITLSRFLRDYLYIPLGGSRGRPSRTYVNLLLVMTLGGLWHGAGWAFIVWGAVHGIALLLNHAWNAIRPHWIEKSKISSSLGYVLTVAVVMFGWIFFRAGDITTARNIILSLTQPPAAPSFGIGTLQLLAAAWFIILFCPNTAQLFRYTFLYGSRETDFLVPIPAAAYRHIVLAGLLLPIALIIMCATETNAFIYFQF